MTEDVGPSHAEYRVDAGGHAPNVIADKAEAQVLVRLVGRFGARCAQALMKRRRTWRRSISRWRFPLCGCGDRGAADDGREVYDGHSAAYELGRAAAAGAGSIHVAHTPDERLAKRELLEAVELYIRVAKQLLA